MSDEYTETGYLESCCWTHERQHCKGSGCLCRCHERDKRIAVSTPYSDAGIIVGDLTYIAMQTRLRIVVRVPAPLGKPGADLPGDFEPTIRQAVADALVGLKASGLEVDYVAVEAFHDSEV